MMTDERAIEILDPEHREHYESIEPVEEACRIGIKAIKRVKELEAENAALRERLKKAVELENKINNGELVDAIWFKSWVNGQICCGSVIGYSDGCFVIACGDDLISANKIYTSREQARYELDKNINKKEE